MTGGKVCFHCVLPRSNGRPILNIFAGYLQEGQLIESQWAVRFLQTSTHLTEQGESVKAEVRFTFKNCGWPYVILAEHSAE